MIKAEVSLYPVVSDEMSSLTGLSAQFLDEHGLDYDLRPSSTSFNTTISGSADEVWAAVRELFERNRAQGNDVVMVTTLTYWDN